VISLVLQKRENVIDVSLLEFCLREDLNKTAPSNGSFRPKISYYHYPEDKEESLDAENNQEDDAAGFRKLSFLVNLHRKRRFS
jgi:glutaminyl-tRNA synthetase